MLSSAIHCTLFSQTATVLATCAAPTALPSLVQNSITEIETTYLNDPATIDTTVQTLFAEPQLTARAQNLEVRKGDPLGGPGRARGVDHDQRAEDVDARSLPRFRIGPARCESLLHGPDLPFHPLLCSVNKQEVFLPEPLEKGKYALHHGEPGRIGKNEGDVCLFDRVGKGLSTMACVDTEQYVSAQGGAEVSR